TPSFSLTAPATTDLYTLSLHDALPIYRQKHVLHRKPRGTEWERIPLEQAMGMVAERVRKTREETWEEKDPKGRAVRRTLGIAHRSEEHTSELQSRSDLVCRLLLEKKKK